MRCERSENNFLVLLCISQIIHCVIDSWPDSNWLRIALKDKDLR